MSQSTMCHTVQKLYPTSYKTYIEHFALIGMASLVYKITASHEK